MSKTTKIIAALGVVAGLGVAALPAFTFATETVTGDVDLYVEVQPAIAMTITGNNDANATNAVQYTKVTPVGTENPSTEGWYERNSSTGEFTSSADTTVDEDKIYFAQSADTAGVDVFAPYSAGNGVVEGHPEAFVIGPSSSKMELLPNASGTMTSAVTVFTNNTSGYTLTVKDKDTDTSIKKDSENYIPASAAPSAGTNYGWSIQGGDMQSAAAMVASDAQNPITVKTTNAKTGTSGDLSTMTYTVATSAAQATGTYTDTIVYTATCN